MIIQLVGKLSQRFIRMYGVVKEGLDLLKIGIASHVVVIKQRLHFRALQIGSDGCPVAFDIGIGAGDEQLLEMIKMARIFGLHCIQMILAEI